MGKLVHYFFNNPHSLPKFSIYNFELRILNSLPRFHLTGFVSVYLNDMELIQIFSKLLIFITLCGGEYLTTKHIINFNSLNFITPQWRIINIFHRTVSIF